HLPASEPCGRARGSGTERSLAWASDIDRPQHQTDVKATASLDSYFAGVMSSIVRLASARTDLYAPIILWHYLGSSPQQDLTEAPSVEIEGLLRRSRSIRQQGLCETTIRNHRPWDSASRFHRWFGPCWITVRIRFPGSSWRRQQTGVF